MNRGRQIKSGSKRWPYKGVRPYFGFCFKCGSKPVEGFEQSSDTAWWIYFLKHHSDCSEENRLEKGRGAGVDEEGQVMVVKNDAVALTTLTVV